MKNLICAVALAAFSHVVVGNDVIKKFDAESLYQIQTISLASGPIAKWIIFKDLKYDASPSDAKGVLEHFQKQPVNKKTEGILIYSKTHSIPLTKEEQEWMTPTILELYNNPKWRESENKLIGELVDQCNKDGINVWINLSSNLEGDWKLLTNAAK